LIREAITDPALQVGNISIPGRRDEAERMKEKVDSGAGFFTTQIVYHSDEFIRLLDELGRQNSLTKENKIFLSLSPVRTEKSIKFLRWLGVTISDELRDELIGDCDTPDIVEERSLRHIEEIWARTYKHLRTIRSPFQVGINLSPVGVISTDTSIELSKRLSRINGGRRDGG
jgi:5,10-methylenetetrahydrofolate reductase